MVQTEVLEKNSGEALAVYVVWEPVLGPDDEPAARKATSLLPDERVKHYWENGRGIGEIFQAAIDLSSGPAWDVYLLYSPGVTWGEDGPPRPDLMMHQLGGRLPEAQRLDGPRLAEAVAERLASNPR